MCDVVEEPSHDVSGAFDRGDWQSAAALVHSLPTTGVDDRAL
jgi:hypothetical protein